jgi:hypothetical protein
MERNITCHALGCVLATMSTFAVVPAVADESEAELAKEALILLLP